MFPSSNQNSTIRIAGRRLIADRKERHAIYGKNPKIFTLQFWSPMMGIVLVLNTKVQMTEASEKGKFTVKQNMENFNVGKSRKW